MFRATTTQRALSNRADHSHASTFGDGATLDVPGAPIVIHVPGHTEGSAALHFAQRDTICAGDAFVTRNVINGATGPQLFSNFNTDNEQAYASLARFERVEARLVRARERWTTRALVQPGR